MLALLAASNAARILVALLVIFVSQKLLRRFFRRRKYRLPPGPKGLPLVGHLDIKTHNSLFDHRDTYGEVSYLKMFGIDVVIFNSAEVIRDAFHGEKTAEVFSARPPTFIGKNVAIDDVIFRSISAKHWKDLHRIFGKLLKMYGEGMTLETVFAREIGVVIDELGERGDQDIDLEDYFEPSLINILCILLIGERFELGDWKIKIGSQLVRYQGIIATPFVDMALQVFPFLRLVPFGPGAVVRRLDAYKNRVLGFLYREIKDLPPTVLESRQGIVYEMMRLRAKDPWIKDSHIEGIIQDTFGAGFITIDSALRAFFLILLHYPNVQTRIQNEIDEVVGHDRRPNGGDRGTMPYTVASILELTRHAVAVFGIPHASSKDTEFRGFTVPEGSTLMANLFRVNHDERVWENPWEFDPTRFLDENDELLDAGHQMRKKLMPFGVGKRMCMGEAFAKARIFLYVSNLLQAFTVKPTGHVPSCAPQTFGCQIVLNPPVYKVKLERRAH